MRVSRVGTHGVGDDSVAGVLAAVDARDDSHGRVARDRIDGLALALVAKVCSRHEDHAGSLDERMQNLLDRRLDVASARHVVQLGEARQSTHLLVRRFPLRDEPHIVPRDGHALGRAVIHLVGRSRSAHRLGHVALVVFIAQLVLLIELHP
jgi:hypothetical protein